MWRFCLTLWLVHQLVTASTAPLDLLATDVTSSTSEFNLELNPEDKLHQIYSKNN